MGDLTRADLEYLRAEVITYGAEVADAVDWIDAADEAMRAVVEIRDGGYQGDSAVINTAFDRLRAFLLPEAT